MILKFPELGPDIYLLTNGVGIGQDSSQRAIVGFLDSITTRHGLHPGPLISPPWERSALVDGTSAYEDELESQVKAKAAAAAAAAAETDGVEGVAKL